MTDEDKIREVLRRWRHATAEGDVSQLLTMMAEDVVFLSAGQPALRGRSAFEAHLRAAPEDGAPAADRKVAGDRGRWFPTRSVGGVTTRFRSTIPTAMSCSSPFPSDLKRWGISSRLAPISCQRLDSFRNELLVCRPRLRGILDHALLVERTVV
jgi:hypothetical protein